VPSDLARWSLAHVATDQGRRLGPSPASCGWLSRGNVTRLCAAQYRGSMPRIWVVDDEPLIRKAILAVLEEVGHESEGFGDAEELYRHLVEPEQELPHLLILDHMLPDEDGAQIVHSLRERQAYREIPILLLTAVSEVEADRLRDLAPVVRKPFDFRDLLATIDSLLATAERGQVANSAGAAS
jgi:DNA-binding response OmpR family regulator